MRSNSRRLRVFGTFGALALGLGTAGVLGAGDAAAASPAVTLIGPDQFFTAQVNGVTDGAAIRVLCAGPVSPSSTGHPIAGQTVSVSPVVDPTSKTGVGYTGASASRVVASFGTASSSNQAVVITAYDVAEPIPTSLNLPCGGTGEVGFVPNPTSSTAITALLPVTYVNEGL
jgi:hypothetical protein